MSLGPSMTIFEDVFLSSSAARGFGVLVYLGKHHKDLPREYLDYIL